MPSRVLPRKVFYFWGVEGISEHREQLFSPRKHKEKLRALRELRGEQYLENINVKKKHSYKRRIDFTLH